RHARRQRSRHGGTARVEDVEGQPGHRGPAGRAGRDRPGHRPPARAHGRRAPGAQHRRARRQVDRLGRRPAAAKRERGAVHAQGEQEGQDRHVGAGARESVQLPHRAAQRRWQHQHPARGRRRPRRGRAGGGAMNRSLLFTALLAAGMMQATVAHADAEITIVNLDEGTGQGLDDPTPATPIGGNPGTTRGEQAQVVFRFAADLWGQVLDSDVPILNTVTFQPLSCTETSGVLGSSGTNYIFSFNSPAPDGAIADTWYHSALTEARLGVDAGVENDLPHDPPDIISRVNGRLGQPGCMSASGWYFGIDGNAPDDRISLLDVIMHEMAHGLGFSGFNNLTAGTMFQGQQDIYSTFVENNATGMAWVAMTDAERQASAIDDTHLVFTGATVTTEAPLVLDAEVALEVTSPAGIAGEYAYNAAQFGAPPTPANFNGEMAVSTGADNLGCGVSTPIPGVSGKLALIDRGTCAFTEKAANAQAGGATGLIIANNEDVGIIPIGEDPSITIPVIAVTLAVGNTFKANLPVTAGLVQQPGLAGTDDDGNVLLYAPTVLATGSSFSHYDTRLTMNALMEPFINDSLSADVLVDLTPALFKDIGWTIPGNNQMLLACDTGVPTSVAGGLIAGANVYASARAFAGGAENLLVY